MISEKIKNTIAQLREMAANGQLSFDTFNEALDGLHQFAEQVEQIEHQPIPMARRHARDEGIVDFVSIKSRREVEEWLRSHGCKVPPRGPGGVA